MPKQLQIRWQCWPYQVDVIQLTHIHWWLWATDVTIIWIAPEWNWIYIIRYATGRLATTTTYLKDGKFVGGKRRKLFHYSSFPHALVLYLWALCLSSSSSARTRMGHSLFLPLHLFHFSVHSQCVSVSPEWLHTVVLLISRESAPLKAHSTRLACRAISFSYRFIGVVSD